MSQLKRPRWTLVQHSKYAAHQDPAFANAVEPAGLTTHQQLGEVVDAGGLLFDDMGKAEDASDAVCEPAMDRALFGVPQQESASPAPLQFHETLTIGGRALYVPPNGGTAS
ncbi:hypothetical protein [Streptomyces sp. NPDC057002]|uniref:hypothetical protein n=1 Tax=Streptomyces sp. NPDC057002 TaxID=3345992 RepID=UPI003624B2B9